MGSYSFEEKYRGSASGYKNEQKRRLDADLIKFVFEENISQMRKGQNWKKSYGYSGDVRMIGEKPKRTDAIGNQYHHAKNCYRGKPKKPIVMKFQHVHNYYIWQPPKHQRDKYDIRIYLQQFFPADLLFIVDDYKKRPSEPFWVCQVFVDADMTHIGMSNDKISSILSCLGRNDWFYHRDSLSWQSFLWVFGTKRGVHITFSDMPPKKYPQGWSYNIRTSPQGDWFFHEFNRGHSMPDIVNKGVNRQKSMAGVSFAAMSTIIPYEELKRLAELHKKDKETHPAYIYHDIAEFPKMTSEKPYAYVDVNAPVRDNVPDHYRSKHWLSESFLIPDRNGDPSRKVEHVFNPPPKKQKRVKMPVKLRKSPPLPKAPSLHIGMLFDGQPRNKGDNPFYQYAEGFVRFQKMIIQNGSESEKIAAKKLLNQFWASRMAAGDITIESYYKTLKHIKEL